MRINQTGAELDELRVHCVVHTSSETLVVWTSTLKSTFLVEVVETYIISIVGTTTAQVHIVVLTDTRLKHLFEPVCIGIILELIDALRHLAVTTRQKCS